MKGKIAVYGKFAERVALTMFRACQVESFQDDQADSQTGLDGVWRLPGITARLALQPAEHETGCAGVS